MQYASLTYGGWTTLYTATVYTPTSYLGVRSGSTGLPWILGIFTKFTFHLRFNNKWVWNY